MKTKLLKIFGFVFLGISIVLIIVWLCNIVNWIGVGIAGNVCLVVGMVFTLIVARQKNKGNQPKNKKDKKAKKDNEIEERFYY